jgi:MFS family permease
MGQAGDAGARGGRLGRNVVVLSWVSFFQDAASELLYPAMPLFVTGVLGAPPAVVGLIEGVAEGTASVMKAVSGRLADTRRRRPLVAWGYGVSSVSKLLIGLATAWPVVLVARFVDRFGKGLRTSPRDAIIATETPPARRGQAFGFHRTLDTAGAIVGPLAGLGLYELLGHQLRPLFFVAFVPAAVSVALVGLVRERPTTAAAPRRPGADHARLPAPFWRVVGFLTLFGLVNFPDALLLLRAQELGLGFVGVVGAYALYNTSYAALSYPAGVVSDRLPRRLVFATGLGIFAVAYLGLGSSPPPGGCGCCCRCTAATPPSPTGSARPGSLTCYPSRAPAPGLACTRASPAARSWSPASGPGWPGARQAGSRWWSRGRWWRPWRWCSPWPGRAWSRRQRARLSLRPGQAESQIGTGAQTPAW